MTREEVAKLLSMAAAYDQRTIGEADVIAWWNAIRHLDAQRAGEAVIEHYRTRRERIMPADVVRLVREAGNARHVDPSFAEVIGQRGKVMAAITGASPRPATRPDSTRSDDPVQRAALSVPCPYCGALRFQHCRINLAARQLHRNEAHPSRVEAGLAA